jgi:hypothetical protein
MLDCTSPQCMAGNAHTQTHTHNTMHVPACNAYGWTSVISTICHRSYNNKICRTFIRHCHMESVFNQKQSNHLEWSGHTLHVKIQTFYLAFLRFLPSCHVTKYREIKAWRIDYRPNLRTWLSRDIFFTGVGVHTRAASNSAYSGYPELLILWYPARRYIIIIIIFYDFLTITDCTRIFTCWTAWNCCIRIIDIYSVLVIHKTIYKCEMTIINMRKVLP